VAVGTIAMIGGTGSFGEAHGEGDFADRNDDTIEIHRSHDRCQKPC
jgi:hypothetical protein